MSSVPPRRAHSISRPKLALRIGPVEIRLYAESLEAIIRTTELDAIVSSDDTFLSMGGGVSAVIASLAGAGIRDEVVARLPLQVGTVAVTSGGVLPIRYIFHAVTVDWRNNVLPTQRTIHQLIRAVLSRCEALSIKHIALPALATGAARLAPAVSAQIIVQALRTHALNPTVLQSVVLPVPAPLANREFATALEALSWTERTEQSAQAGGLDLSNTLVVDRFGPKFEKQEQAGKAAPPTEAIRPSSRESRPLLSDRYVLLEEIGRGGMGIVYLSWDLVLRRVVAIKILRPDAADPQSLRREAAAAFELTHEGIVRLYHFEPGVGGSQTFLVMEYLPWPSGEKWIADAGSCGLPTRAVADVGVRVCNALAYAHSHRILHLDIKPSNIFVDPSGERAKLGDFGLSRVSGSGGTALQFRPSGTPAYMAPEPKAQGAKVSPATDVFHLAATLWDFLTGAPPRNDGLEVKRFEPARQPLLSILLEALGSNPATRPSALRLGEMMAATA